MNATGRAGSVKALLLLKVWHSRGRLCHLIFLALGPPTVQRMEAIGSCFKAAEGALNTITTCLVILKERFAHPAIQYFSPPPI